MGGGGSARWPGAGVWLAAGASARWPGAAAWLAAALCVATGFAFQGGAAAWAEQDDAPAGLDVGAVDASAYPTVGLTVIARDGIPEPAALTVTEDGEERAAAVTRLDDAPLEVVVILDTSEDAADQLRPAVAAVTEFALRLPSDAEVGVVAAGGEPQVAIDPTRDTGAVVAALAELETRGDPAVLPAVPVALDELGTGRAGRRAVVVVAGGASDGGEARGGVAGGVRGRGVLLFAVASDDVAADLAAAGATVHAIDDLAEASAGLRRVADDLASLYRVEFTAQGSGTAEISVAAGDRPADRATVMLTPPADADADAAGPADAAPAGAPDRSGRVGLRELADRFPDWAVWPAFAVGSAVLLWLAWAVDERRARARSRRGRLEGAERAAAHLMARLASARRRLRRRWRWR